MPRQVRYIIEAIGELERQLQYTPRATRLRQMDAAEQLAAEIEPQRTYPEEYIIYRITGYRPESADPANAFVGEALMRDLATFVLRLSRAVDLPPNHKSRTAIPFSDIARRLNVSPRTVQRYRRQGLICHYVDFPERGPRLACFEDALERFISRNNDRMMRAAAFTRTEDATERVIIDQARRLREQHDFTLNQAARHIAPSVGRAHETLRGILQRHDRSAAEPIFTERGPLTEREMRLIHRAWGLGVPINVLSERFRRSSQTIRRAINHERAALLRSLDLTHITLPTFEHEEADAVLLGHSSLTTQLWRSDAVIGDPLAMIDAAHGAAAPARNDELAMIAGYNFLKHRAKRELGTIGSCIRARSLDAIETDLRWAALVKQQLVMLAFPGALEAIEQHLGRPLPAQPGNIIIDTLLLAFTVLSGLIDAHDPSREQRVSRHARFVMDRTLSQRGLKPTESRAAARHEAGSLVIPDRMSMLVPWWRALMPRRSWRERLDALDDTLRRAIAARYGWDNGPPRRVLELAEVFQTSEPAMMRMLDRAARMLRKAARAFE